MTKKLNHSTKNNTKPVFRYLFVAFALLAFTMGGSQYKAENTSAQPIMHKLGRGNFTVSTDRVSEMRLTADLAYNMNLATKNYINMDYVSVTTQYALDQSSLGKLEKPNITNLANLSRGVREYVVVDGDSVDSLAARFKISADQIRWSNGLRDKTITVGQSLFLPTTAGFVYTVKVGDTVDTIASRYGTTKEHIISYNDLETSDGLTAGVKIILPNGVLPANERPENQRTYQSAIVATQHSSVVYSYYQPVSSGNPLPWGWCTWYAWDWRKKNMPWNYHLPSSGLGDARYWDDNLRGRYVVNNSPVYGAVFQNETGYYGHVGIVTAINDDGTITISDMNGVAGWGRVGSTTVPQSTWSRWKFIHQANGTE